MPGPRRKAKGKGKASQPRIPTLNASISSYVEEIERADGWEAIVDILCRTFELPDLSTRSGLKKVHARFETISKRLDRAYADNLSREKVLGGIVSIYAGMCIDSILRNKLFAKGILSQLKPLLDVSSCRRLALRCLTTMTHHGGESIRTQIARELTSTLIRLIEENPDDPIAAELAISTISHSICAILCIPDGEIPNQAALKELDIPKVICVFTESMRKHTSSYTLMSHGIFLLANCTLHFPKECKAYPSMVRLLVAALRSTDIIQRSVVLGGLTRLHREESEEDQRIMDPRKFMAGVQRGYPDHLSKIMMDYGVNRCDTVLQLQTSADHQKAMMKCAQDRDLRALGLSLAQFILRTEFSINEGGFQTKCPRTGRFENTDMGLPFKMWTDALPHCAAALRATNNPKEQDMADILELKYLVLRQRVDDAVELAKKSFERSPDVAYFCYIVTLSADNLAGLRYAKKGMKCKSISPFVRFQMMQRAVEHAADEGIRILQALPDAGESKWEEGIAYLTSAMEDAKCYLDQAPPDNRHMKTVSYWYILLTMVIQGPELSTDLRELKDARKKLRIADEFGNHIGVPPPKTNCRLTQQTIVKLYPEAAKEWNDTILRFNSQSPDSDAPPSISSVKVEDDLARWLERLEMDDDGHGTHSTHCAPPKINKDEIELYRCSFCGNPSAVLRKCGGCTKVRYCDTSCQKLHWREHKKACNTL